MPVSPSLLERGALARNLAPAPMLDFLGAQTFRALVTAVRLGALEGLRESPAAPDALARRIGADARGVRLLLMALEATGYVALRGDRYSLTTMTERWLPLLAEGVDFFEHAALTQWADLERSVREGHAPETGYADAEDPVRIRELLVGLRAFARGSVGDVVKQIGLPARARRLVDLGGGHGLYSVELCRRHPDLTATIFDLPGALDVARETVDEAGLGDRIELRGGDFHIDELGGPYDAALLFNIVHGYDAKRNEELFARLLAALTPGASVAILDQLADTPVSGGLARAAARLQGLNLFHARGGEAYSFSSIASWLERAGYREIRRRDLRRSPGSSLVLAAAAR